MNNHRTSVQGLAEAICPVINALWRYLTNDMYNYIICVDFFMTCKTNCVYMTLTCWKQIYTYRYDVFNIQYLNREDCVEHINII